MTTASIGVLEICETTKLKSFSNIAYDVLPNENFLILALSIFYTQNLRQLDLQALFKFEQSHRDSIWRNP